MDFLLRPAVVIDTISCGHDTKMNINGVHPPERTYCSICHHWVRSVWGTWSAYNEVDYAFQAPPLFLDKWSKPAWPNIPIRDSWITLLFCSPHCRGKVSNCKLMFSTERDTDCIIQWVWCALIWKWLLGEVCAKMLCHVGKSGLRSLKLHHPTQFRFLLYAAFNCILLRAGHMGNCFRELNVSDRDQECLWYWISKEIPAWTKPQCNLIGMSSLGIERTYYEELLSMKLFFKSGKFTGN